MIQSVSCCPARRIQPAVYDIPVCHCWLAWVPRASGPLPAAMARCSTAWACRACGAFSVVVRAQLCSGLAELRNPAKSLACRAWAEVSAVSAPGSKWPWASAAPRMACCCVAWSVILDNAPSARTLLISVASPLESAMPSLTANRVAIVAE